jgi:hypothetical protein
MYRVLFILGDCVFTEMKYTKESVIGVHPCSFTGMKYTNRSAIGCIFQCSFTGNEMYKTKLPLFASKEKHVGKNTIYSCTRTLIGQKNFPNLRLTDKMVFFLANTLYIQY